VTEAGRREVPQALLERIRGDLQPIRPVLRPQTRAVVVALLAVIAAIVLLSIHGARQDLPSLASPMFLGMLAARIAAGSFLIFVALRDAMPAGRAGPAAVSTALAAGVAVLFLLPPVYASILVLDSSRIHVGSGFCYALVLGTAAVPFVIVYWLITRAYPLSPLRAGLLAGLGSGVLAEAAQFVACSNARPAHTMLFHGGGALTVALAGLLGGLALSLRRRREMSF